MLGALLAFGLFFAAPSVPMIGPANCQFAIPADISQGSGAAEWIGACASGHAEGPGVIRVPQSNGLTKLFYGRVHAGLPVAGMLGDSQTTGWQPIGGFDASLHEQEKADYLPGQDPHLWQIGAAAARIAADHYTRAGNKASAAYYAGQARLLSRGPGE